MIVEIFEATLNLFLFVVVYVVFVVVYGLMRAGSLCFCHSSISGDRTLKDIAPILLLLSPSSPLCVLT